MSRRDKSKTRPGRNPRPVPAGTSATGAEIKRSGAALWRLRLLALLGVPVAFIALLELALRLIGYGYPTAFLLPQSNHGQQTWVQNNRFGWRFFGPRMARLPYPISILRTKPPGAIRIFVFGESAAYGDPRPAFGLSRMLQALLELRHPGVRFEVVNAAMTGINSHTVLPIARDCARADGDIWVVYMGNNEVVGPFGAGTVFGQQAPPLALVRLNLALKTLRTGQLLDSARQWVEKPAPEKSEWGGMMMFVNQQVSSQDPRMTTVYENFRRNLADIVHEGRKHRCGIVVSTVAVNLRDCAPFASLNQPALSADQRKQWEQLFQRGVEAQRANQLPAADDLFREAARIDDTFAELRFRQAQCSLALGRVSEAQAQFAAARDLDALHFRSDRRLNNLIRATASNHEHDGVLLADAEHEFASNSRDELPGSDLFYEHVHLTFAGNYLLARTIASQVEKLLPAEIVRAASQDLTWPSPDDCAKRLAWNPLELRAALNEILVRVTDPPFTRQFNHGVQVAQLSARLPMPRSGGGSNEVAEALKACDAASGARPEDPVLLEELASLKASAGDLTGAAAAWRQALDLLPSNLEGYSSLGMVLAQQQRFDEAATAFQREFALDSQDVSALQNLAMCLVKENRLDNAMHEYRRALAIKPRFGPAWLGLGQLLEKAGRPAEASDCFRKALTYRMHRGPDLATLARFCVSRTWYGAAATNYVDALKLSPGDAALNYEAGECFAVLGRHLEAAQLFAAAGSLSPDWAQAQFQWGLQLGQLGQPAQAAARFQEAVRLKPDLIEARLNLGIALANQKSYPAALDQFEQVIQRSPSNALALRYIESLRQAISSEH